MSARRQWPCAAIGLFAVLVALFGLGCKARESVRPTPTPTPTPTPPPGVASPIPAPPDVASPSEGAQTSPTGLASKVLIVGAGATHPTMNESVEVNYAAWTAAGAPFMDGKGVTFHLARAIPGWIEALEQMVPGEKRRLWIPASLAYDARADAPSGALTFDLQLVKVIPGPAAPPDVATPPADALRFQDGLSAVVLAPGGGKIHPSINDVVTLTFASWTDDGAPFERAEGVRVRVGDTIAGWAETLAMMVAGERRRIWLSPALAYGAEPGAPNGALIFDLELLDITPGPRPPPYVYAPAPDATTTKDGLASKVFVAGSGKTHPRVDDGVRVRFTAWDDEGRLRYGSEGDTVVSAVSKSSPGWAEGLELMVVGEKRMLWVPESLQQGIDPIRPRSMLTFIVELLEILPAPKAPHDLRARPRNATLGRDGLASKLRSKGTGLIHPHQGQSVTIQYSSWTVDGKLLGSSFTSGEPETLELGGDGLADAIALMVEGERRRVWIPKLRDAKEQASSRETVVIDVDLLKIEGDEP